MGVRQIGHGWNGLRRLDGYHRLGETRSHPMVYILGDYLQDRDAGGYGEKDRKAETDLSVEDNLR